MARHARWSSPSEGHSAQVSTFRRRDDREELMRLYRLTGLVFDSVPVSLLKESPGADEGQAAQQGAVQRLGHL